HLHVDAGGIHGGDALVADLLQVFENFLAARPSVAQLCGERLARPRQESRADEMLFKRDGSHCCSRLIMCPRYCGCATRGRRSKARSGEIDARGCCATCLLPLPEGERGGVRGFGSLADPAGLVTPSPPPSPRMGRGSPPCRLASLCTNS